MGETNKRHNRKIWRPCPVCKGRVVLGHRNQDWWVYCEDDASHIPQRFFPYAHEAIDEWNVKANKRSNGDNFRAMTDDELARTLFDVSWAAWRNSSNGEGIWTEQDWLDWIRQEEE